MGLWILEDRHLSRVPGTSVFSDDPNAAAVSAYDGLDLSKLKHGSGRNSHIVLVPQPSDDPNDPLNWPQWKKHMVVYGTVICGALGPLVSADLVGIAAELDRSISAIARALGSALVLALAFATVAWSVLSVKIGKRPVFLASTLLMLAGSVISGFTNDYNTLVGSRILQGVGQAVLEFLVGASIADIYFTHERGVPVALWNLALLDGINVTPPISGQVITALGWRWCFRLFAISCGVLFILQVFCMPETTYQRAPIAATSEPLRDAQSTERKSDDDVRVDDGEKRESPTGSVINSSSAVPAKKTYLQELSVWNGVYPDTPSVMTLLWRPVIACVTPVCLWAGLLYGVAITWLVLIATSVAQIFSAPLSKDVALIIFIIVSPFIGALLAALLCGPLTDFAARRMSKANQGIFEPEFRLVLVIFYAFFGALGFFGWGLSAQAQDPWIGPVVFFGCINFGITIGCSAAIGYVVDAHRQSADSALGAVILFSFIITLFINDWFSARGTLNVFGIVGGVTLFTCLLTIHGKRARSWIHRTMHFDENETMAIAH
ncbi:MFS general substrate transporter [Sistotremastrum niveocremeum HHB9708]|uniref:MFS general substrate transporter n=1 Tax=Sistotremastrum niveocremeum HHB9708 TaxID=1314777 RepID=A0A164Y6Y1_9AGAM|nr:MFS general substrate transporter [Sistotremastrum niveocremeum HHB9708]